MSETIRNRSLQISAYDKLITVTNGTLAEVKRLQRLLEKEVIGSVLYGDDASCGWSCCGSAGFELRVKKEDATDARRIIQEDFRSSTALDTHDLNDEPETGSRQAEIVKCPACGCSFSLQEKTCPECGLCF